MSAAAIADIPQVASSARPSQRFSTSHRNSSPLAKELSAAIQSATSMTNPAGNPSTGNAVNDQSSPIHKNGERTDTSSRSPTGMSGKPSPIV